MPSGTTLARHRGTPKPRPPGGIEAGMWTAGVITVGAAIYLAFGALAGLAFVVWGAGVVDPSARGSGAPWGFRAIIWPGAAALWPVVVVKWIRAARAGKGGGS